MIDKYCKKCKLHKTRKQVVEGKGNLNANLLLVGEAPGQQEDLWGIPFVGDAGRELDSVLIQLGINLGNCWIDNVVKCRPPDNRNPEIDEIMACCQYIMKLVNTMNPKLIITMGLIATKFFVARPAVRGEIVDCSDTWGSLILPVYHPSWLAYSRTAFLRGEGADYNLDRNLYIHHFEKNIKLIRSVI